MDIKTEQYFVELFKRIIQQSNSRVIADYYLEKMKTHNYINLYMAAKKYYEEYFLVNRIYIEKELILVDYENINSLAYTYLLKKTNCIIYFFTNKKLLVKSKKISRLNEVHIESNSCKYKNACDFFLNFTLFSLLQKYHYANVEIISNDYGFQDTVTIANTQYFQKCIQKSKKDLISTNFNNITAVVNDARCLVLKNKPSNKEDMFTLIKNELYDRKLSTDVVEFILYEMIKEGVVGFHNNCSRYQGGNING